MMTVTMLHIFVAITAVAGLASAQYPTVTIDSGPIVGTPTTVFTAPSVTVNNFLGVPFAESPPRRFTAPTYPKNWTTPLDTKQWRAACMQVFPNPPESHKRAMQIYATFGVTPKKPLPPDSEDCMYLNVYAPSKAPPPGGFTVMVFMVGGNLQFGNAGQSVYDGSSFAANQDVIVVVPNYRTNVFGFLQSPELDKKQGLWNIGFLDQRFALEWVQRNIKQFGGDPAKVTIFGISSGGNSVKQLIATPPKPITYRAAIMQSQANSGPIEFAGITYNSLISGFNCGGAKSKLDCLRAVPAQKLADYATNNTLFFPHAGDGVTGTSNIRDDIDKGTCAQVPIMMGTSTQEGRSLAYIFGFDAGGTPATPVAKQGPKGVLQKMFPGIAGWMADMVVQSQQPGPAYDTTSNIITDVIFRCTTSALSQLFAAKNIPVYRYLYGATFPNVNDSYPYGGVFHSSDMGTVFGSYDAEGRTQQQLDLSRYMQKTWADFAKNPYAGPGWPKLGSNGGVELQKMGFNGGTGGTLAKQTEYDDGCLIYTPFLGITGM